MVEGSFGLYLQIILGNRILSLQTCGVGLSQLRAGRDPGVQCQERPIFRADSPMQGALAQSQPEL